MNGITKETFHAADEKTRSDILFDLLKNTYSDIQKVKAALEKHPLNCDERFKKLESNRIKDTGIAAGMGFFGGFSAILAKISFFK
jgi:hypothetical protein